MRIILHTYSYAPQMSELERKCVFAMEANSNSGCDLQLHYFRMRPQNYITDARFVSASNFNLLMAQWNARDRRLLFCHQNSMMSSFCLSLPAAIYTFNWNCVSDWDTWHLIHHTPVKSIGKKLYKLFAAFIVFEIFHVYGFAQMTWFMLKNHNLVSLNGEETKFLKPIIDV